MIDPIPMATRAFSVLAPASRTTARITDDVQHVAARFGTTLSELAIGRSDTGLHVATGVMSGTATGVDNATRGLAALELGAFARLVR